MVTLKDNTHHCALLDGVLAAPDPRSLRNPKQVTPKRVRRKTLASPTVPKGPSARHPPPTFLFLPYALVKEPKPESFKPKPTTASDNKAAPKSVPVIQPCQVMETTRGAGQTPAPPSLLDVYSHHQLQPSSAFPKKNPNSKKSNKTQTPNWGKQTTKTTKTHTKSNN